MKTLFGLLFALFVFATPVSHALAGEDADAIVHLMKATFDKPESPLTVEPVVVVGDSAIAGWLQDGRGGRALLRRKDGQWAIHLCAGDGLKQMQLLHEAGIDHGEAEQLIAELAKAEAPIDPAKLKLFASFDGVVMIGAEGHSGHKGHQHQNGSSEGQQ